MENINHKNTLYINRKKADTFLSPTRVQFPLRDDKKFIDFFGNSIKTEQDLVKARENFNNLFYSRTEQGNKKKLGSYDYTTNVITLFKGANASTVIHESWHFFIEEMYRSIESGIADEQTIKDFETLLEFGCMTLDEWKTAWLDRQLGDDLLSDAASKQEQARQLRDAGRLNEAAPFCRQKPDFDLNFPHFAKLNINLMTFQTLFRLGI